MPSYQTADIAIIGGGIIGMSCAYELSQQGTQRIVLFDKSNLAGGTTGGSAGIICLHDLGEIYAALTLLGYERIQQLRRDYQFPFHTWGSLDVVYEPDEFPPSLNSYARRFGGGKESIYHHEWLDRAHLVRRFPWIRADGVRGGVFFPNQGFVDPYALVALYEELAVATGRVEIHRNTPILQIREDGETITQLITRRGVWCAGAVLNAGGPWGAKIAAMAGSALELTPQRIQVCAATGFEDGITRSPVIGVPEAINGEGVWCRGELGDMLLFGQHHNVTKDGFTVDPDHVNRLNDPDYPAAVAGVCRRYWQMPKSTFLNGWCCVYGTTEDGFPIVSRDERLHNFYHAVGLNGHGITCHAGVAQAVAQLILHDCRLLDLGSVLSQPAWLDFSALDAGRFARRQLLDFALRDTAIRHSAEMRIA